MERKVFRSRISVLFIPIFVAFLFFGWFMSKVSGDFVGLIIIGICFIFGFFAIRSLYYVVTNSEIQVYYMWGFMGKPFSRMLISAITSVERSYYPYAAATSLKRLRIRFKKGYKWYRYGFIPVISPVREQEFLETLKAINPNIQIDVNDKKGWWRIWDWDFNNQ